MSAHAMRVWSVLWLLATPAWAHHSVVSQYDTTQSMSISGNVKALQLGNPHSYLVIEVVQPGGRASVEVRGEMASAGLLRRAGWTKQSLLLGERIRLTGSPARHSAADFYITSVTRADGSQLALVPCSLGSSGGK